MAIIATSWIWEIFFLIFVSFGALYAYFKIWASKHWARRGIPYEEPSFIFGNMKDSSYRRTFPQVLDELYFKHKEKKLLGIFVYTKPSILINDVELLKHILVKDFSHFHDRGLSINEKLEPLSGI